MEDVMLIELPEVLLAYRLLRELPVLVSTENIKFLFLKHLCYKQTGYKDILFLTFSKSMVLFQV